jgi:hypothetical protein
MKKGLSMLMISVLTISTVFQYGALPSVQAATKSEQCIAVKSQYRAAKTAAATAARTSWKTFWSTYTSILVNNFPNDAETLKNRKQLVMDYWTKARQAEIDFASSYKAGKYVPAQAIDQAQSIQGQ